jgi:hypothetical protein
VRALLAENSQLRAATVELTRRALAVADAA